MILKIKRKVIEKGNKLLILRVLVLYENKFSKNRINPNTSNPMGVNPQIKNGYKKMIENEKAHGKQNFKAKS